jgi:hypothetical protein
VIVSTVKLPPPMLDPKLTDTGQDAVDPIVSNDPPVPAPLDQFVTCYNTSACPRERYKRLMTRGSRV